MIIRKYDKENKFFSIFDTESGHYIRSGILENGKDTGEDPFMTAFPELLDIGIMGHCEHGQRGFCAQAGVQCYQNGPGLNLPNMSLENFKKIADQCRGKTFQFALGGRGDPNVHENFVEILEYCHECNIVPNYTTSGLWLDNVMAMATAKYCGAVAVSWYNQAHTYHAVRTFKEYGVSKVNLHFVLSNHSIDQAIFMLKTKDDFPKLLNAVIFLLHKPVGCGQQSNVLQLDDPRLKEFFELIETERLPFKIGFDSCTVPALVNLTKGIDPDSYDTCEGGRWSAYITPDMKMLPCSFDNQDLRWAYDISNDTIENAWRSPQFEDFRDHFRKSCSKCERRVECRGGCPIKREIVLCGRKEKKLYESTKF